MLVVAGASFLIFLASFLGCVVVGYETYNKSIFPYGRKAAFIPMRTDREYWGVFCYEGNLAVGWQQVGKEFNVTRIPKSWNPQGEKWSAFPITITTDLGSIYLESGWPCPSVGLVAGYDIYPMGERSSEEVWRLRMPWWLVMAGMLLLCIRAWIVHRRNTAYRHAFPINLE